MTRVGGPSFLLSTSETLSSPTAERRGALRRQMILLVLGTMSVAVTAIGFVGLVTLYHGAFHHQHQQNDLTTPITKWFEDRRSRDEEKDKVRSFVKTRELDDGGSVELAAGSVNSGSSSHHEETSLHSSILSKCEANTDMSVCETLCALGKCCFPSQGCEPTPTLHCPDYEGCIVVYLVDGEEANSWDHGDRNDGAVSDDGGTPSNVSGGTIADWTGGGGGLIGDNHNNNGRHNADYANYAKEDIDAACNTNSNAISQMCTTMCRPSACCFTTSSQEICGGLDCTKYAACSGYFLRSH